MFFVADTWTKYTQHLKLWRRAEMQTANCSLMVWKRENDDLPFACVLCAWCFPLVKVWFVGNQERVRFLYPACTPQSSKTKQILLLGTSPEIAVFLDPQSPPKTTRKFCPFGKHGFLESFLVTCATGPGSSWFPWSCVSREVRKFSTGEVRE